MQHILYLETAQRLAVEQGCLSVWRDEQPLFTLQTYLQRAGFYSLQYSIYLKPLSEKHKAQRYIQEVQQLPLPGSHIRALILTWQQFISMQGITGADKWIERLLKNPQGVIVV